MAAKKKIVKKSDGSAYYITLFTIEGHKRWRLHTSGYEEGFENEAKIKGFPIVTTRKYYKIDRVTGDLSMK